MATRPINPKVWCASKRSYADVLAHYQAHSSAAYASELNWFAGQSTLKKAVARAAVARGANRRRLSHQCCVSRLGLRSAHDVLLQNLSAIRNCKTFSDLHTTVETLTLPIKGIGPLYVYDTALRIGAYLSVRSSHLPTTDVYLHAGSLEGARSIRTLRSALPVRPTTLKCSSFPPPLSSISAYELENLLCLYRGCLQ
jgi:hypothetical protein